MTNMYKTFDELPPFPDDLILTNGAEDTLGVMDARAVAAFSGYSLAEAEQRLADPMVLADGFGPHTRLLLCRAQGHERRLQDARARRDVVDGPRTDDHPHNHVDEPTWSAGVMIRGETEAMDRRDLASGRTYCVGGDGGGAARASERLGQYSEGEHAWLGHRSARRGRGGSHQRRRTRE